MMKRVFAGLLAVSLMVSSVPVSAAVPPEQAQVVSVLGSWVINQIYVVWDQMYNQHPRIAISLLMMAASAFAYKSNTELGLKMRKTVAVAQDIVRRKCFGAQDKKTTVKVDDKKAPVVPAVRK